MFIMKKLFLILVLGVFVVEMGCKKESIEITQPPPPPPQPPPPVVTVPYLSPGDNLYLLFPEDTCILKGYIGNADTTVVSYSWKKISGPSSYNIDNPDELVTKVGKLQKGTYVFSLTVTLKGGAILQAYSSVFVFEKGTGTNEIILKDEQWGEFWGDYFLLIQHFHSIVPIGTFFKVYIKRDNSNDWIEVLPEKRSSGPYKYSYSPASNWLAIEPVGFFVPNDTPDVKIVF
jgi:hypothetical protein